MLEFAGMAVEVAETAAGALERCRTRRPDLILLDVLLPDDSGFNLCRKLRKELGADTPVLFMTAKHDLQSRLQGFRAGGQDFIPKPFFLPELVERVRVHLQILWNREAMAHKNVQLQRREQTRRDMLDMIVHDIKLSLATIGANLDLIDEEHRFPDKEGQRLLKRSEKTAEGLLLMLHDILDLSRAQGGRLKPKQERVPVAEVLEEVRELFASTCALHGVRCRLSVRPRGLTVVTDRTLLSRILANLVSNAIQPSSPGEKVWLGCLKRPPVLQFFVSDQGPGIPDRDKERIFGKHVSLDPGGLHDGGSYGIGLFFCGAAADAMGGRVWAEDRKGGGSRFILTLPQEGKNARHRQAENTGH